MGGRGERRLYVESDDANEDFYQANLGNNGCCGDMGKAFWCFC